MLNTDLNRWVNDLTSIKKYDDLNKLNSLCDIKKMGNELEKANIIYGYKANAFDSGQLVKQDKYVKDWLAAEGKAYAPFLTADENAKGISTKMKDQIIAAKKAHNAKKAEAASRFPAQQYAYGQSGFAGSPPGAARGRRQMLTRRKYSFQKRGKKTWFLFLSACAFFVETTPIPMRGYSGDKTIYGG
mgnify:CR=1 FL=1